MFAIYEELFNDRPIQNWMIAHTFNQNPISRGGNINREKNVARENAKTPRFSS